MSQIRELYNSLNNIPKEIRQVTIKMAGDENSSKKDFIKKIKELDIKKEYISSSIKNFLEISLTLKALQKNNKLKGDTSDSGWDIFKKNLPMENWMPLPGELCSDCGRVQSIGNGVAVIMLDSKSLKIQCSYCFKKNLQQKKGLIKNDATS